MPRLGFFPAFALLLPALGCGSPQPSTPSPTNASPTQGARNESTPPAVSSAVKEPTAAESATSAKPSEAPPKAGPLGDAFPCGPYTCQRFARFEDAFLDVVTRENPRVLGIGESHAQAAGPAIDSTTARFTNQLLPLVSDKTHSLVVELMAPNAECRKKTEEVREQQKPVTEPQAATNQNEYVTLGQKARALGATPYLLRPSCDDLNAITKAGNEDVIVMLETIARLTAKQVADLVGSQAKDTQRRMVIAYGGALHNDLEPREGRESWSYGPTLKKLLDSHRAGAYVELDLIVPEMIQDGPGWRSMPWYGNYGDEVARGTAVAMQLGPQRWAVFDAPGVAHDVK
jgi:hypothetical protein